MILGWRPRGSVVTIIALVAACSEPSTTESGFISLGRDNGDAGVAGTAGFAPTGGTDTGGAPSTGGYGGKGGSMSTGGKGGTSTGGKGGTAGDDDGEPGGVENGGPGGDATGGTSTGGAGPSCGSGAMPFYGSDPYARDSEIADACGRAGPNSRVCLADDSVWYCGQYQSGILEKNCAPNTCITGCCHATSDPCPEDDPDAYDCAGDCGGYGLCMNAPIVPVTLAPNFLQVIRVGSNTTALQCGDRTRHYFELFLDFEMLQAGPAARVTVLPPWKLGDTLSCDSPGSQCFVSQGGGMGFVVVSTDAESPPARNVIIETSSLGSTCP